MSDDSQNPYATPSPYAGDHSGQDQRQPGLGYVRQIPILAIFTIVQGALLTLMALVCLGYGIFFAFLPGIVPEAERAQMQAESGAMFTIFSAVLIGLGVFALARIFHPSVVDRRFSLSYWVWEQYFEFCDH